MTSASIRLAALATILVYGTALCGHTTRVASASEGETRIHLEVHAPPACMTANDVAVRIAARAPDIRISDEGAAFAVQADFGAAASGEVAAELTITARGHEPSTRRVIGRSCSEAADAIALIVAVTLAPDSAATGPAAPLADAPTNTNHDGKAQSQDVPSRPGWRLGGGAAFIAFQGPAPDVMPGFAVYGFAASDRPAVGSPAFALGVAHGWRSGFVESGGVAAYTLDVVLVDGCPMRLGVAAFEARICASALIGALSSSGSETIRAASASRPFAATGASLLATAHFGRFVALSLRVAAHADIVRDSYEFAPSVFYQAAPVTLSGGIGLDLYAR